MEIKCLSCQNYLSVTIWKGSTVWGRIKRCQLKKQDMKLENMSNFWDCWDYEVKKITKCDGCGKKHIKLNKFNECYECEVKTL